MTRLLWEHRTLVRRIAYANERALAPGLSLEPPALMRLIECPGLKPAYIWHTYTGLKAGAPT
jgi:hypothetical protein